MKLTIPPYVGQGWTDNSEPDLSAENLNAVDAGIAANSAAINAIANAVVSQIVNDPSKIASIAALYAVNQTVTTLNSNLALKANASDLNTLKGMFVGDGSTYVALLLKNGTTWYRLQLRPDGSVAVYKSTDSGATWPTTNVISQAF